MDALIIEWVAQGGYLAIWLLMVIENVFPPIPSEVILGLGGVLVAQGKMQFWPLLLVATLGSTTGNYVWYWMGDRWGYERMRPLVDRHGRWLTMDWQDVEETTAFFRRHGHWAVLLARCLPLFRTMISLPAGLAHMGKIRFLAFTFVGAALWNAVLIFGGTLLQTLLGPTEHVLSLIVLGVIVLGVAGYLWRFVRWKPRDKR
ncbi:MAG: DedA family protein [Pontixanthobacter sp.]